MASTNRSTLFRWRDAVMTSELEAPVKYLLLTVASFMNSDGGCWPEMDTIAKRAGRSPGHCRRLLRTAELEGWIARDHERHGPGRGTTAIYTAVIPPTTTTAHPCAVNSDDHRAPMRGEQDDHRALAHGPPRTGARDHRAPVRGEEEVIEEVKKAREQARSLCTKKHDEIPDMLDLLEHNHGAERVAAALGTLAARGERYGWPSELEKALGREITTMPASAIDYDYDDDDDRSSSPWGAPLRPPAVDALPAFETPMPAFVRDALTRPKAGQDGYDARELTEARGD